MKQTLTLFAAWILLAVFCISSPVSAFERRSPVVDAVAKAGPAVVNIRTEQVIKRGTSPFFGFSDPFFEEFFREFSPPRIYNTQSLGSGVIIDRRGYILTNAHVIDKASKIFVALPNQKKEREAVLIGMDKRLDLAVLRIEQGEDLFALEPGRSDDLLVGETVIAIGNPLGLGHSITTGIVSAPRRQISVGDGFHSIFIQTDALINPGNSGGPLLNINGELIGINTAIVKNAQGIGFAIPIDTARRVLQDLIEFGQVRHGFLGVLPVSVGKVFAQEHGDQGVLIDKLAVDSPAALSGLHIGDVILSFDSNPVSSPSDYFSILRSYTSGDEVTVKVLRGIEILTLQVKLATIPEGYALWYGEVVFGFSVKESREGVEIRRVIPESPAGRIGIQPGDMIIQAAGEKVNSIEDLAGIILNRMGQEPLRFLIGRGQRGYYVDLPDRE